jgi:hypothetical protein
MSRHHACRGRASILKAVPVGPAMAVSGKTAARTIRPHAPLPPRVRGGKRLAFSGSARQTVRKKPPLRRSRRAIAVLVRKARWPPRPAPVSAWPRPRSHGGTVRLPGRNRITPASRDRPAATARCGPPVGTPADRAQRTRGTQGAQPTRHDHNVTLASSVTKLNIISMLALTNNCLATNVKHNRHAVQRSLKVTASDRRAGCYLQQTFSEFRA